MNNVSAGFLVRNMVGRKFCMVDCETTGLTLNARVWQVGTCDFTLGMEAGELTLEIEGSRNRFMGLTDRPRDIDPETVHWKQEAGTYDLYMKWSQSVANVYDAGMKIVSWKQLHSEFKAVPADRFFVANWIDADFAWIRNSMEDCGIHEIPFSHRSKFCLGTLRNMHDLFFGKESWKTFADPVQEYIHERFGGAFDQSHVADADCVYQSVLFFMLVRNLLDHLK